jgi:hypothetical protein
MKEKTVKYISQLAKFLVCLGSQWGKPWRRKNVVLERTEDLVQSVGKRGHSVTKGLNAEAGEIEGRAKADEDPFED